MRTRPVPLPPVAALAVPGAILALTFVVAALLIMPIKAHQVAHTDAKHEPARDTSFRDGLRFLRRVWLIARLRVIVKSHVENFCGYR